MFPTYHTGETRPEKRGIMPEEIAFYKKQEMDCIERTNSWYNRFRKPFPRHEKKTKNYLGLIQLSHSIIIYRKIVLE